MKVSKYHKSLFNIYDRFLFKRVKNTTQKYEYYKKYQTRKKPLTSIIPFHNIHKGQRCFIIGGGPSLKKIDPRPLKKEITFGVNSIFLIFDWLGFQPTYYCVEDWFVYEDRFKDILAFVTEPICFFPLQFLNTKFDRKNHIYYRAIYEFDSNPDWPKFSKDPSKLLWIGGTVTYVCMQLAFYMGFSEVYLIGMDHSYVKPKHVETNGKEWTSHGDDPNHFHPAYFGKGYRWHDPDVERMGKAYCKAKSVYENSDRIILNATVGGKLEIFERKRFEEII